MSQIQLPQESRNESTYQLIRLLELVIDKLHQATFSGGGSPWARDLGHEMSTLKPGDLVVEISTVHLGKMRGDDRQWEDRDVRGIGYLLRIAQEPVCTSEEWNEGNEEPEPVPTLTATYLRLLDGREMRWTNAAFVRVPDLLTP